MWLRHDGVNVGHVHNLPLRWRRRMGNWCLGRRGCRHRDRHWLLCRLVLCWRLNDLLVLWLVRVSGLWRSGVVLLL